MPFENGQHPGGTGVIKGGRRSVEAANKVARTRLEKEARKRMLENARIALTRDLIEEIVAQIPTGNYPGVIAEALGCPAGLFQGWLRTGRDRWNTKDAPETNFSTKNDPEGLQVLLYLSISRAEAEWEVDLVARMAEKIDRGSIWQGEMTMLQRRKPDRWDARGRDTNTGGQTFEEQVAELERDRSRA